MIQAPMHAPASRPQDAGLQPERTALAWQRTGIAALVNALLVLRSQLQENTGSLPLMGIALLVGAGAVMAYAALRKRELAASGPHLAAVSPLAFCALAVFAGLLCLTSAFTIGASWTP